MNYKFITEITMSGKLDSDPLFVVLTRPNMILGVSVEYLMINLMISVTWFIQTSSWTSIFVAVVTHFVGCILCFRDPRFMLVILNKVGKCNQCSNKSFYGANS